MAIFVIVILTSVAYVSCISLFFYLIQRLLKRIIEEQLASGVAGILFTIAIVGMTYLTVQDLYNLEIL
jgi:hypothetical protein